MLNAVLAALHLLNIRKLFIFVCFFLFLRVLFCHLKDSGFVSRGSVRVAPQKRHLQSGVNCVGGCHRDPPQIGH